MARKMINDMDVEKVVGGSIVFNEDCTTCGRNRNDQYRIVNFDDVLSYILDHNDSMSEKQILNNLVDMGLLVEL